MNAYLFMSTFGLCLDQMMDEQISEPDDESDVKVLVLSPRCWAVSAPCYLERPIRYFPQKLCSYLDEFTDFYSNSEFIHMCYILQTSLCLLALLCRPAKYFLNNIFSCKIIFKIHLKTDIFIYSNVIYLRNFQLGLIK